MESFWNLIYRNDESRGDCLFHWKDIFHSLHVVNIEYDGMK
jgi:hypothetical protein